ncbi:MAG TPA: DoxX family protein [Candidatus Nanoarchaeia archaeon]|nr:DoxX family protein [Candidatus Nanoarchaeia archaeon]
MMVQLYEVLYWIGLILFGGYFVYNGVRHFIYHSGMAGYAGAMGVPQPSMAVYVSGALLVLGGMGLILNFYTHVALWLLVVFLVPVTLKMHAFWKTSDPAARMSSEINFYKNMALLGAVFMLMYLIG